MPTFGKSINVRPRWALKFGADRMNRILKYCVPNPLPRFPRTKRAKISVIDPKWERAMKELDSLSKV